MAKLCILGGGGHAKVVYEAALAASWTVVAVAAPEPPADPGFFGGMFRIADEAELHATLPPDVLWHLGFGDLALRRRVLGRLEPLGRAWAAVVHPHAIVSPSASVGPGALVMARVVVNASASIGPNAILNTGAICEHDARIGANAHIAPGALLGGGAAVGGDTLVGSGAIVLPGVHVGANCVVGAGAVVVRNLPDGHTAVGVPARAVAAASSRA